MNSVRANGYASEGFGDFYAIWKVFHIALHASGRWVDYVSASSLRQQFGTWKQIWLRFQKTTSAPLFSFMKVIIFMRHAVWLSTKLLTQQSVGWNEKSYLGQCLCSNLSQSFMIWGIMNQYLEVTDFLIICKAVWWLHTLSLLAIPTITKSSPGAKKWGKNFKQQR